MSDTEDSILPFEYAIRAPMFRDQFDHEHHDRELEDWLRNNVRVTSSDVAYGARWILFRDSNHSAVTINTTEQRLAIFPNWAFRSSSYGDYTGNWTVPAVATGAGTVRFRLYDYITETYMTNFVWDFDFDAATADNLNFSAVFSGKAITEDFLHVALMAMTISGAGTIAVADEAIDYNVLVLGLLGSDPPGFETSVLFEYTGDHQYFEVPPGISMLQATLVGGAAANFSDLGGGSRGALMKVRFVVSEGEMLEMNVAGCAESRAGAPKSIPGWNGGGTGGNDPNPGGRGCAGGGASDIRRGAWTLDDRLVVASGGASGGSSGTGGIGGWPVGYPASVNGWEGLGGTQSAGGAAGGGGAPGTAGTFGEGGDGQNASGTRYGGGGGGGWYGGGGGGSSFGAGGGGGGGGSSYFDSTAGVELLEAIDGGGPAGQTCYILVEW